MLSARPTFVFLAAHLPPHHRYISLLMMVHHVVAKNKLCFLYLYIFLICFVRLASSFKTRKERGVATIARHFPFYLSFSSYFGLYSLVFHYRNVSTHHCTVHSRVDPLLCSPMLSSPHLLPESSPLGTSASLQAGGAAAVSPMRGGGPERALALARSYDAWDMRNALPPGAAPSPRSRRVAPTPRSTSAAALAALMERAATDAERQLTQIVQEEIRDLLRRTLDAESEVAPYKNLLAEAHCALADAKQDGGLQWQQRAADAEERQRAAIEARDADAEANLAHVQADLERQLKSARKWKQRAADAEERQRAAIEARDADTEEKLARVQADLERQLKAGRDDMESRVALKDAAVQSDRVRMIVKQALRRMSNARLAAALGSWRRTVAALEKAEAKGALQLERLNGVLARLRARLERAPLARGFTSWRAYVAAAVMAAARLEHKRDCVRTREVHEVELRKVRAELATERRAHLELMRDMKADDELRRKERDESVTRAHEQQSRDAASAAAQRQRVQEQVCCAHASVASPTGRGSLARRGCTRRDERDRPSATMTPSRWVRDRLSSCAPRRAARRRAASRATAWHAATRRSRSSSRAGRRSSGSARARSSSASWRSCRPSRPRCSSRRRSVRRDAVAHMRVPSLSPRGATLHYAPRGGRGAARGAHGGDFVVVRGATPYATRIVDRNRSRCCACASSSRESSATTSASRRDARRETRDAREAVAAGRAEAAAGGEERPPPVEGRRVLGRRRGGGSVGEAAVKGRNRP